MRNLARLVFATLCVFGASATPLRATAAEPSVSVAEALADYYTERGAIDTDESAPRLLVIGIDGASWATLDPLIEAGALPNLERLKNTGRFGVLESTSVPESAIAWTSMRTGVGPGVHGVFKFRSPTTTRPSYWRELDRRGIESIVIAVPKVSAREPIRGVVIEGWTARRSGDYVRPKALKPFLARAGFDPGLIMNRDPGDYIARMELRTEVAISLMAHEPWRHMFVVYEYGDTAAHRFALDSLQWSAVQKSIDREIGRLVAVLRADDAILIVSDHGWTHYEASIDLNAWLIEEAFEGWTSTIFSANSIGLHATDARLAGAQRESEIMRVEKRLAALMDPDTGKAVVARIRRTREVFPGPQSAHGPLDLLVDLTAGNHAVKATKRRAVFSKRAIDHHSRDGLYLLAGRGVPAGRGAVASIFAVAPTALAFFGIEPASDLAGEVLYDFGASEHTHLDPLPGETPVFEPDDAPTDSDDELIEKLRSLGYVE